jgi:hypothetical protein
MMVDLSMQDLFSVAMKRNIPALRDPWPRPQNGEWLNVGAGNQIIPGFTNLGKPDWEWPFDKLPYGDETVESILAFNFLEHLSGEQAITMLVEFQRVLQPGGIVTFSMPHHNSHLFGQDLTHKSMWNEESFRNLFVNDCYDPSAGFGKKWKLKVHTIFLMGVVMRNLSVMGQLIREG